MINGKQNENHLNISRVFPCGEIAREAISTHFPFGRGDISDNIETGTFFSSLNYCCFRKRLHFVSWKVTNCWLASGRVKFHLEIYTIRNSDSYMQNYFWLPIWKKSQKTALKAIIEIHRNVNTSMGLMPMNLFWLVLTSLWFYQTKRFKRMRIN